MGRLSNRSRESALMGNLLNIRTRHARSQMRTGIKLYQAQNPQQAIRQWRAAIRKLKSAEDRFLTVGYIVQAFCDSGEFEQMLYAAVEQLELANVQRDDFMKSEALLNLARANERLAEFEKAIGYAESSLALPGIDSRSPGYAHLAIAQSHMGLSNFQQSLQQFERSMKVAIETADKLLELQISLGLGSLFTMIRDLNKGLIFLQNALNILGGIEANHVHAKYKSAILCQLSTILRLRGKFSEAREACEESIDLAKKVGNKPIFARSLASLADICGELGETEARETITKSWARYEQAFRLLRKINDRMGQILVLASMAKSASENKGVHYAGRCECQAIQLNKKCLELASIIGYKHAMLECHLRLQELYSQLADDENADESARVQCALVRQMELFCNFCGQRYGETDDSLQALNCSHIFHERCLQKFFVRVGDGPCTCPKCRAKTGLMESISLSSSNAQTPANESISDFICSFPSTSLANPTPPPLVLCERNFDTSRWSSPATVTVEAAERQIYLSTSTSATFSIPSRPRGPNGNGNNKFTALGGLSTFAAPQSQQKENANPQTSSLTEVEVHGTMEKDLGREQPQMLFARSEEQQQIVANHVEMGSSKRDSANAGGAKMMKKLVALGKEKMAISPVAEVDEEAEDQLEMEQEENNTRPRRGVTEL